MHCRKPKPSSTMKKAILLFSWLLLSHSAGFSQIIIQDTVYWNTSTFLLVDDVIVTSTGCLIIESGTQVYTDAQYFITVYGSLQVLGEVGDSVYFEGMNSAGSLNGGGIRIHHQAGVSGNADFQYCVFERMGSNDLNVQDSLGALAIRGSGYTSIKHCRFEQNTSFYQGGAIYIQSPDTILIKDCDFISNQSKHNGGAIYTSMCTVRLEDNLFESNKAADTYEGNFTLRLGGGVYLQHNIGGVYVGKNIFRNNLSLAAVYTSTMASSIENNLIHNNSGIGLMGGHSGSSNFYVNNTITRNEMLGVFTSSPNELILNCIVWMNGFISGFNQIMWLDTLPAWVLNSCVSQGYMGPSIGLTTQDPYFVNPSLMSGIISQASATNWELQPGSSCINTGLSPFPSYVLPLVDLKGDPRITGPAIDIGAYEADLAANNHTSKAGKIQPYPNPVNDHLYLNMAGAERVEIELLDLLGKRVVWQVSRPDEALRLGHLPSGQYVLRVKPEGEQPALFKIIKM